MKHDGRCEYGSVSMSSNNYRITCHCAERAYAKDPLSEYPLPADVVLYDSSFVYSPDDWDYPT